MIVQSRAIMPSADTSTQKLPGRIIPQSFWSQITHCLSLSSGYPENGVYLCLRSLCETYSLPGQWEEEILSVKEKLECFSFRVFLIFIHHLAFPFICDWIFPFLLHCKGKGSSSCPPKVTDLGSSPLENSIASMGVFCCPGLSDRCMLKPSLRKA